MHNACVSRPLNSHSATTTTVRLMVSALISQSHSGGLLSTTSHGRLQLQVERSGVYDELLVDAPTPWLYHQLQLVAKVVQTLILTG